jgi:hypothetical protein
VTILQKARGIEEEEGLEQEDFQAVLRAAGETEPTQGNIKDWLELGEGDWISALAKEEIATVIFLFIFISTSYIIKFSF